jgi:short-subunit dehydrogenase
LSDSPLNFNLDDRARPSGLEDEMRSKVMITGATGGLGKAFAVECARRGWDLFLTDLEADRLDVLADGLRRTYGIGVVRLACDLTDPGSRSNLFDFIRSGRPRFWALINVAGGDFEGTFRERRPEQLRTILRLNIEGALEMTHAVLGWSDPGTPFRIIMVSSLAAFFPMPVRRPTPPPRDSFSISPWH